MPDNYDFINDEEKTAVIRFCDKNGKSLHDIVNKRAIITWPITSKTDSDGVSYNVYYKDSGKLELIESWSWGGEDQESKSVIFGDFSCSGNIRDACLKKGFPFEQYNEDTAIFMLWQLRIKRNC